MIFLVHHDANATGQIHRGTGAHRLVVEPRQLLADKMTLVQQQSVLRRQLVDADEDAVFDRPQAGERLPHLRKNPQPLAIAGPRRERVTLQVSRQADPRGDDDVGVLARRIEPARTAVRKQREIEHHSIPRSLSRMSAASSNCSASIALLRRSRSTVALDTGGSAEGSGAT